MDRFDIRLLCHCRHDCLDLYRRRSRQNWSKADHGHWMFADQVWDRENQEEGFLLKLKGKSDTVLGVISQDISSGSEVTTQLENEPTGGQLWKLVDENEQGWSKLQNVETEFFLTSSSHENSSLTVEGKFLKCIFLLDKFTLILN